MQYARRNNDRQWSLFDRRLTGEEELNTSAQYHQNFFGVVIVDWDMPAAIDPLLPYRCRIRAS